MALSADPQAALALRAVFVAAYALWGTLWALVAWYYGRAAYASWRVAGGRWRSALGDIASPFTWALRSACCRVPLLRGSPLCAVDEVPSRYYRGHLLRWAIFLGSLTPAFWGFYFMRLDRSGWRAQDIAVNLTGTLVSCVAASCHLFLAYKSTPRNWTRLVLLAGGWLLLAPPVLLWLGAY